MNFKSKTSFFEQVFFLSFIIMFSCVDNLVAALSAQARNGNDERNKNYILENF